jgi:V/A-type H+/Na+-transporting ATPase subunit I
MISRTQPARRFQMLCAREDLPQAMAVLASNVGVQLEAGEETGNIEHFPTLTPELAQRLSRYQELAERYRAYWPKEPRSSYEPPPNGQALDLLDQALAALESWRQEAQPVIQKLHEAEVAATDLSLLFEMLTHLDESVLDFNHIAMPTAQGEKRFFDSNIFVIPEILEEAIPVISPTLLRTVKGENSTFLVAVGLPEDMQNLSEWVVAAKGRIFTIPSWCIGKIGDLLPEALLLMEQNRDKQADFWEQLRAIAKKYEVSRLLQVTEHLQWFFSVMEKSASNDQLARVEGWTDGNIQNPVNSHFEKIGIKALMDVAKTEVDNPPMLLVNPSWAKPFEIFPRLLGVPGRNEADPSPLLAFIAPLLFGFMFGDVGQGAVFVLAGIALSKRFDAAWLLISGGLSAIFFGLMFGSVFCWEEFFPPLWLHPAHQPLMVLAIPLILGFMLIIGGMALNGLGQFWVGAGKKWLLKEGGMTILYVGLVSSFLHQVGWWIAAAGLGWFLIGNYLVEKKLLVVAGRLGHLLEATMQLAVNTLSFARIGAFALAHAGLSMAVVTLASLPESMVASVLILVFGNILILALEGLVVSVQTTRLILFEFFVRFLRGTGRPFKPLPTPPL